ncbi:hypothetical protein SRHO_G00196450 [Serrasalmus rhombeus]
MEQEMELRSPPSATAYNCFSKKDRIQERQREEEQQVPKENDIRRLEEMVKQQEMEIARFHKRQERLKQKLEKIKEQLARKEQKTLKIVQRYKHLKRERLALKEKEREMDSKREQQQEKEEERKRAREKYMERKEQRRAERRKKFPQKETSFGPLNRDQPPASTESKAEDLTSETPSQVQTDGPTSGETAEEKPEWGGHDGGEAVIIEVESQQVEPAAPSTSGRRMLQRVLSTVRSLVEAGVLTVNLKTCRDFSKSAPLKKGSRAAVRITIGRTVKYTVQQPYSDPMCFDEWKHFSLQIQKEDICGVQQSSLVVVELIMVDPDLTTPVLIGRDTIMLQDILKKSSLSHQFNLRLMQKKVCKLDADLAFSYGSMGYGYSHQLKHAGRTIESLVQKSLFPRCPPNEDRDPLCNVITPSARTRLDFIPSVMLQDTQTGTECRISAGLKECIQKRGSNVITPSARTRLDVIPSVMLQAVAVQAGGMQRMRRIWAPH